MRSSEQQSREDSVFVNVLKVSRQHHIKTEADQKTREDSVTDRRSEGKQAVKKENESPKCNSIRRNIDVKHVACFGGGGQMVDGGLK